MTTAREKWEKKCNSIRRNKKAENSSFHHFSLFLFFQYHKVGSQTHIIHRQMLYTCYSQVSQEIFLFPFCHRQIKQKRGEPTNRSTFPRQKPAAKLSGVCVYIFKKRILRIPWGFSFFSFYFRPPPPLPNGNSRADKPQQQQQNLTGRTRRQILLPPLV